MEQSPEQFNESAFMSDSEEREKSPVETHESPESREPQDEILSSDVEHKAYQEAERIAVQDIAKEFLEHQIVIDEALVEDPVVRY